MFNKAFQATFEGLRQVLQGQFGISSVHDFSKTDESKLNVY